MRASDLSDEKKLFVSGTDPVRIDAGAATA
jgi:hypothetical protein